MVDVYLRHNLVANKDLILILYKKFNKPKIDVLLMHNLKSAR